MGLPCVSTPAYGTLFGQHNLSLGLHVLQGSPNCLGAPGLFKAPQLNPKYVASRYASAIPVMVYYLGTCLELIVIKSVSANQDSGFHDMNTEVSYEIWRGCSSDAGQTSSWLSRNRQWERRMEQMVSYIVHDIRRLGP
jgi:hypothetical protein